MNAVKIKNIARHSIVTLALCLLGSVILSTHAQAAPIDNGGQAATSSTPTTAQIKATIQLKCGTEPPAISKEVEKRHKGEDAYKTLSEACFGTGDYKDGASKKAQRAKRLIDICDNYQAYLVEAGAYKSKGLVNNGDCDDILANTFLRNLTLNLENYPSGTLGTTEDPALDCRENKDKCDLMKKYVNPFINFLAVIVGLAVTIGIISGGLRYVSAGDDPQKVSAAKGQVRSAIIALLAFIFLYAAIQWMIPQTG